jgi:hypothetical protein
VNLTLNDGDASEAGPNPGSFVVTRTGSTTEALNPGVDVQGTATFTADYATDPHIVRLGGTVYRVTIPAGQPSVTITITPVQDGVNEGDENAIFTLVDDGVTYVPGPNVQAEVVIADDVPIVNLTLDGPAAEKGPTAGGFIVTRSNNGIISQALNLGVDVQGTAKFAADYATDPHMVRLGGTVYRVTIPAGQLSATVTITPVQDGINEGDENAIFTLVDDNQTYASGPNVQAEVVIADDVPIVNLTLDGPAAEKGPTAGSFTVTRSNNGIISQALNLGVDVQGTATFAADYATDPLMVRLGGTVYRVTIPPGQLSATITITPVQDGINEGDESAIFTLVGDDQTYVTGPNVQAEVVIADDVPIVNLTLDGPAAENGPTAGGFTVTRSNNGVISQALNLGVDVQGTAKFAADYATDPHMIRLGGTVYRVTIPAGQLSATTSITPVQDGIDEDDETAIFTLVGDNETYTVGESITANVTIFDFVEKIFKDSFEDR